MQFGFWQQRATLFAIIISLFACNGEDTQPPPIPGEPMNVSVIGKDGYNTLTWSSGSLAAAYNVYYSTDINVTTTNATKISNVHPPFDHTGIVNNTPYYYIVTSTNIGGESMASNTVTATPQNDIFNNFDPLFSEQWNLQQNTNEDINVVPAWNTCDSQNTCRGENILVAIVDNGLEIAHEDLHANIAANLSYNYLNKSTDPTPPNSDFAHGTSVGGIIGARDLNNIGLRGVAPRARLVGYNYLLSQQDSDLQDAMIHDGNQDGQADAFVNTNSWGPADDGSLDPANSLWLTAVETGVNQGRNGKGIIYTWAAGNGGATPPPPPLPQLPIYEYGDNSNFDGIANSRHVIAVAAITSQGTRASYSEYGANLWISAPAGLSCNSTTFPAITTTDLMGATGYNGGTFNTNDYSNANYTKCFSGTSAAAPIVAGAVALILQANPDLTWRDLRIAIAKNARQNDSQDNGWINNGAGYPFNHKYGFGVIDVGATVAAVNPAIYQPLAAEKPPHSSALFIVNQVIGDNNAVGVADSREINASNISKIEFVEITLTAPHQYFGDLEVALTHSYGNNITSTSRLAEGHYITSCTREAENCGSMSFNGWVFGSAQHLDEPADGTWTLTVTDIVSGQTGSFTSWKIKFYGT